MDTLTREKRSWNMARIKGKNTKPEIMIRSMLHRQGYRFRIHVKKLPGCPDIVMAKYKTVIFVHGCFWHRHPGCKYAYTPKTRQTFWNDKFRKTVENDKKVIEKLKKSGWQILIIWECELSDMASIESKIADSLNSA